MARLISILRLKIVGEGVTASGSKVSVRESLKTVFVGGVTLAQKLKVY
jgi:hypothetical protein